MFFFFFFDEITDKTDMISVDELGPEHALFDQFDSSNIRVVWHKQQEKWYFSIVDVLAVLTESNNPQAYWRKLKQRLNDEGNETVTNCHGLKMPAADGKMRITDAADSEQLLRLIQSVPSPKAEPFKLWLAKVGSERLDEMSDPEIAINRGLDLYKRKGYSNEWINERLKSIDTRKVLTSEWERVGIKAGVHYATLTDVITKEWSGFTTREYKNYKGLKKENLRDNMSPVELVLNMLSEAVTAEISSVRNPNGFKESMDIAKVGGKIAGNTRRDIEDKTGKSVVTPLNSKNIRQLDK